MLENILAKIKIWKNKLIDLSKRNKLLNFKVGKTSTVSFVGHFSQEVFDLLVTNKKTIHLKASGIDAGHIIDNDEIGDVFELDIEKEELGKKLLRLYLQSNATIEEQGYNVLFVSIGALEWYESENSDIPRKAPILLIPVELARKSVKKNYKLSYIDGESIILNPALAAKLKNEDNIDIDNVWAEDAEESINLGAVFGKIRKAVIGNHKWEVKDEVYLSTFSFAKFVMYKDLEKHEKEIIENKIVEKICNPLGSVGVESISNELPEFDLDQTIFPKKTFQILDADSSQQKAIYAAKTGKNLVIEGPPGTGKSQTIANIISEALSEGKKVLFVSEKMAALEVVKSRLDRNGLGDYCFELHSRKANKNVVYQELARVMEKGPTNDHDHDGDLEKLVTIREGLNKYVKSLHAKFGNLEISPYRIIQKLSRNIEYSGYRCTIKNILYYKKQEFEYVVEILEKLSNVEKTIGNPLLSPLIGVGVDFVDYEISNNGLGLLNDTKQILLDVVGACGSLSKKCNCLEPKTRKDIETLSEFIKFLERKPDLYYDKISSVKYRVLLDELKTSIEQIKSYREKKKGIDRKFKSDLVVQDKLKVRDILVKLLQYKNDIRSSLKLDYWKLRVNLLKYQKNYIWRSKIAYESQLVCLNALLAKHSSILDKQQVEVYSKYWQDENSDCDGLEYVRQWLQRYSEYASEGYTDLSYISAMTTLDIVSILNEEKALGVILGKFDEKFGDLKETLKIEPSAIFKTTQASVVALAEIIGKIDVIIGGYGMIDAWAKYNQLGKEIQSKKLQEFVTSYYSDPKNAVCNVAETFMYNFYRGYLDEAFKERPILRTLDNYEREKSIKEFKELDKKQIELSKVRVQYLLSRNKSGSSGDAFAQTSELGIVIRETRKRKRHMAIRKLFETAPNIILNLKPCLMMSPITAAQYVDPRKMKFDLVLFDEASQINTPDSIGSIIRAKQVIVAGDRNQLPPTSFFQNELQSLDEDDEQTIDDLDCILDECCSAGFPSSMLKWHYRSEFESLITFSNYHIYNNKLHTFPSVFEDDHKKSLEFRYISNGIYDRGKSGANIEEARSLIAEIMKHARTSPDVSLGVGTFSIKQKDVIDELLHEEIRNNPDVEFFFDKDRPEHFFVKNLETIQGDERDIIFISVCYGKDADGKLLMNFGPINQSGGKRRLNVLVTRARRKVVLFSSIKGDHIDLSKTSSDGVKLLKEYLDYVEKGIKASLRIDGEMGDPESYFEESVYEFLKNGGHDVRSQIGCSGYRIDLAIMHKELKGKYVLGIECDGASYHNSASARDRDRLRKQVLQNMGWKIYNIWSTDWFKNNKVEREKLLRAIEAAQKNTKEENDTPEEKKVNIKVKPIVPKSEESVAKKYQVIRISGLDPRENVENRRQVGFISMLNNMTSVVEVEYPIHRDELYRRTLQFYGIAKLGSKLRKRLDTILEYAIKNNKVNLKEAFVYPYGKRKVTVRNRAGVDDVIKKIEYVSLDEIGEAALIIVRHDFTTPMENLITNTAKLLGFDRTSADIRERVMQGIVELSDHKKLKLEGQIVSLRT